MLRSHCLPRIERPRVLQPQLEATCEEKAHAEKLAAELARVFRLAAEHDAASYDPCSPAAIARQRLDGMSSRGRRAALDAAAKMDKEPSHTGAGMAGIGADLTEQTRRLGRQRLEAMRPQMSAAIKQVAEQVANLGPGFPRTTVQARPSGEIHPRSVSHLCADEPLELTFEWQSTEPGAGRVYWEFRGPIADGYPGRLLAHGYSERFEDDDSVRGEFTVDLRRYLPPGSPDPTRRYYVRVLPLTAPDLPMAGTWYQPAFATGRGRLEIVGEREEPEPPAGVGPWSTHAVIDIGLECRTAPTQFDIEQIDFYRKARAHLKWFQVDTHQSGGGVEEYSLRAFMVENSLFGSRSMGSFGSFLSVKPSAMVQQFPLDWKSAASDLGNPLAKMWPRLFTIGMSVLEKDGGDELDEWHEAINELAREAVEGDLAQELRDYLHDLQAEIDEATAELHAALAAETAAYLAALIAFKAAFVVAAFVAFMAGLIGAFTSAGERDDVYGVAAVVLALGSNDRARMRDGTAGSIQSSRVLSAGGSFTGTEEADRFELDEIQIQLIDGGGPDEAGLGGIVRMGLTWEFFDVGTDYY